MNRQQRRAAGRGTGGGEGGPFGGPGLGPLAGAQEFARAVQLHKAGRLTEAEQAVRQCLAVNPRHPGALHLLGLISLQAGSFEPAARFFAAAIAQDPGPAHFHNNLGSALRALGRFDEAQACFRRAIQARPDYVRAIVNLAQTQATTNNSADAVGSFRKALNFSANDIEALSGLAFTLQGRGEFAEAATFYRRVLDLSPERAEIWQNLAGVLYNQGDLPACVDTLKRALALQPSLTNCWQLLALAYEGQANLLGALDAYQQTIARDRNIANAHNGLGNILSKLGRLDEAVEAYRESVRLAPDALDVRSNLIMTLHSLPSVSGADVYSEARAYAARVEFGPAAAKFTNDRDPDRPLRIGYVSADFRNHPVGYFLERVLASHDRSAVEAIGYSDVRFPDEITDRLRNSCVLWREIAGRSDADVARLIKEDRIDVLVDLAGHTGYNRLGVFGARAAPVQASWLGYFGTTGLSSMDYVIGDDIVLAPGDEVVFSEALVRLASPYLCWSPPEDDVPLAPPPALANGYVTFGCFNNRTKITPEVVAAWSEILRRVPDARLLLKTWSFADEGARDLARAQFAAHDIQTERLRFEGLSPRAAGLAAYNQIDIALDPFPFGGCTTTADTLWMGVPVVTLDGARWSGRMSKTILTAVGLEDWVAPDVGAYVARAVDAAAEMPTLAALRAGLRENLEASAFCDGPAFARRLEAACRGMWRRWANA